MSTKHRPHSKPPRNRDARRASNYNTDHPAEPPNTYDSSAPRFRNPFNDDNTEEMFTAPRATLPHYRNSVAYDPNINPSRPISQVPLDPSNYTSRSSASYEPPGYFNDSDKYSFSSYQHPADINPPPNAYPGDDHSPPPNRPLRSSVRRSVSFAKGSALREYDPDEEYQDPEKNRALKNRGLPSQMLDLFELNREIKSQHSDDSNDYDYRPYRPDFRHNDSMVSTYSQVIDPDDPRVTGVKAKYLEDPHDIEKNTLRQMDYRHRRKHLMRVKIEFNVTCKVFDYYELRTPLTPSFNSNG